MLEIDNPYSWACNWPEIQMANRAGGTGFRNEFFRQRRFEFGADDQNTSRKRNVFQIHKTRGEQQKTWTILLVKQANDQTHQIIDQGKQGKPHCHLEKEFKVCLRSPDPENPSDERARECHGTGVRLTEAEYDYAK